MPLGSSSEAPVIRPGPSFCSRRLATGFSFRRTCVGLVAIHSAREMRSERTCMVALFLLPKNPARSSTQADGQGQPPSRANCKGPLGPPVRSHSQSGQGRQPCLSEQTLRGYGNDANPQSMEACRNKGKGMGFPTQDLRERHACIGQQEPQRSSGHDLHLDFRNRGPEDSSRRARRGSRFDSWSRKATKVNGEAPGGPWGKVQNSFRLGTQVRQRQERSQIPVPQGG